ncbi:hypothetical protein DZ860_21105 [Vibrio sinensis]|uniref:Uncharacterized protein n=1 Tax=Vibrio sinensis TaxID=2302434 RepID=A0A3A6QHH7_9VIBR|nr:hypothetical protein [Vibrio sinensis]RJX65860.1 hypothetical protein DZ860_21105 [Vibrio sinensis]
MTPETKKKIRMAVLATIGLSMVGYMAFDMLSGSSSTPPPISSNLNEPNTHEPNLDFMVEAASLAPAPQFEPQDEALLSQNVTMQPESLTTTVTYQASIKAKEVLDALEATYISKVNTDKLTAQIAEQTTKQSLDAMQLPPQAVVETITTPVTPNTSVIDAIEVKSIVVTPTRTTAWLSVNGENIPVQYGVWVGDVRVVNITKDFVRFSNKDGKGFTKHVPSSATILTPPKGVENEPF